MQRKINVELDENDLNVVIRALDSLRKEMKETGEATESVDEMLLRLVTDQPRKSRGRIYEAR